MPIGTHRTFIERVEELRILSNMIRDEAETKRVRVTLQRRLIRRTAPMQQCGSYRLNQETTDLYVIEILDSGYIILNTLKVPLYL